MEDHRVLRKLILNKANGKCASCGKTLTNTDSKDKYYMQIDHYIPICKGGKDSLDNLYPLCKSCRDRKGTSLFLERISSINTQIDNLVKWVYNHKEVLVYMKNSNADNSKALNNTIKHFRQQANEILEILYSIKEL